MQISDISAKSVVLLVLVVLTIRELVKGRLLLALASLFASVLLALYQNWWHQITSLQDHYNKSMLLMLAGGIVGTAFLFHCFLAPATFHPRAWRPQHPSRYRRM